MESAFERIAAIFIFCRTVQVQTPRPDFRYLDRFRQFWEIQRSFVTKLNRRPVVVDDGTACIQRRMIDSQFERSDFSLRRSKTKREPQVAVKRLRVPVTSGEQRERDIPYVAFVGRRVGYAR